VFGAPGGEAGATPNREFPELWLRFVTAVCDGSQQALLAERGRDLAANMSEHGYGMAFFVANELRAQIKDAIALLADDEIEEAFGARDMWQVVDQVSTNYLGGARNTHRHAAMAQSGAAIIDWFTIHADTFDHRRWPAHDTVLVPYCEQWLAAYGVCDTDVDGCSYPISSPAELARIAASDLLTTLGNGHE
jgi:hypothetical protein